MSFLIDTDICSTHLKSGGNLSSRFIQYSGRLHLSVITLGELYTWALRKNAPTKHLESIMAYLSDVSILDVNHEIAQTFGTIRAQLFDQGIVVPGMDIMIAATALVHGLTLVTHNTKHFENISGLKIVDWLEV
jgi:tRNA(fMet)-specific endonuclease VapC